LAGNTKKLDFIFTQAKFQNWKKKMGFLTLKNPTSLLIYGQLCYHLKTNKIKVISLHADIRELRSLE
jgi:hypothetical protein